MRALDRFIDFKTQPEVVGRNDQLAMVGLNESRVRAQIL